MTMLWVYLLEVLQHFVFPLEHCLAAHYWARPCGLVDLDMVGFVVCLLVLACIK